MSIFCHGNKIGHDIPRINFKSFFLTRYTFSTTLPEISCFWFSTRISEGSCQGGQTLETLFQPFFAGSEKNRKRDLNQYFRANEDLRTNNFPGRGDIPIIHGDCDGMTSIRTSCLFSILIWHFAENLLRSINDLIALVKKLQQDIANQHADIRRLQSLIENCAGCKEAAPIRARPDICATANICFPGKLIRLSHLP